MSISPVSITRVSNNLRTTQTLETLRRTQLELFTAQTRLATGRGFVSPSEDPVRAAQALDLTDALARQRQFGANVQYGDTFLSAADSALSEINGLIVQASSIASQTVSNLTSEAERESTAEIVAAIRQQVQSIANRQFNGRNLFGGRSTLERPFVEALGGIAYVGDTRELLIRADHDAIAPISVPGNLVFGALSAPIASDVDLAPLLSGATRLEDITAATGEPITTGVLVFNEVGGVGVFTVDLAGAATIGDVVDQINASAQAAGADLVASLSGAGLTIATGGWPVTVTDAGGGLAAGLGVLTTTPSSATIIGDALAPRVTRLTPVSELAGGAGIDLASGFIITNGPDSATIDLRGARTVQDILNTINNAGVYVFARINDAETGIAVYNRVSGTSLTIGENGGTTATDLGIRTFHEATPLSSLNFGDGVTIDPLRADLRITARNGAVVDVDLDAASTIGEVIDRINQAALSAGVNIRAALADVGNGVRIVDTTGGSGALSVSVVGADAPQDLGLTVSASGSGAEILGADVNPTRTEGVLGALYDLERALRHDDTRAISAAGHRLDTIGGDVTRMHGIIGARSQAMALKRTQMDDASAATEVLLSQVRDLDYAEAITHMQAAMTELQANLQTSSAILNLSILDFLR